MMVSTQTDYLASRFGDAQAIRMLADAGFDAFDLSLFRMMHDPNYEMNGHEYREKAAYLRRVADECGILCNQAHAPFHSSTCDEAETAETRRGECLNPRRQNHYCSSQAASSLYRKRRSFKANEYRVLPLPDPIR